MQPRLGETAQTRTTRVFAALYATGKAAHINIIFSDIIQKSWYLSCLCLHCLRSIRWTCDKTVFMNIHIFKYHNLFMDIIIVFYFWGIFIDAIVYKCIPMAWYLLFWKKSSRHYMMTISLLKDTVVVCYLLKPYWYPYRLEIPVTISTYGYQ